MEKRINKKIEDYVIGFKDGLKNKINELDISDKTKVNSLLEYLYDYNRLVLVKDDLIKRKRVKNSIPATNRCNAKRANNEQCTRRRKSDSEYCGTHSKGSPNGFLNADVCNECNNEKVELTVEDINGIIYYIDNFNNVYKTEDVLSGKENPQIIAKYTRDNNKINILYNDAL